MGARAKYTILQAKGISVQSLAMAWNTPQVPLVILLGTETCVQLTAIPIATTTRTVATRAV